MDKFFKSLVVTGLLFFFLGLVMYPFIFNLTIPKVYGPFKDVQVLNIAFERYLYFAFIFAFTPLVLRKSWKYAHIVDKNKKIISGIITAICIASAIFIRHRILEKYLKGISLDIPKDELRTYFEVNQFYLEYYLLAGIIAGCIMSSLVLKRRQSSF